MVMPMSNRGHIHNNDNKKIVIGYLSVVSLKKESRGFKLYLEFAVGAQQLSAKLLVGLLDRPI